jgi:hypothetical protein
MVRYRLMLNRDESVQARVEDHALPAVGAEIDFDFDRRDVTQRTAFVVVCHFHAPARAEPRPRPALPIVVVE